MFSSDVIEWRHPLATANGSVRDMPGVKALTQQLYSQQDSEAGEKHCNREQAFFGLDIFNQKLVRVPIRDLGAKPPSNPSLPLRF